MRLLLDNIKNIPGWRTDEKIVVFVVDDYGNVCLDSLGARNALENSGLKLVKHIERLDALETREDLEMLFETLGTFVDSHGRPPIFTANALCANVDFSQRDPSHYCYQSLQDTFSRLSCEQPDAYNGVWNLWQEGIAAGLFKPQFHGREHLNVEVFERKLKSGDRALRLNLDNRSLVGIGSEESMPGVGITEAFGTWQRSEVARQREILASGLDLFESTFGFRSSTLAPPGMTIHPELYEYLESLGVRGIDKPQRCTRRIDRDKCIREWNVLGTKDGQKHVSLIRNVVFEPTKIKSFDSVLLALKQIELAFRWKKPAIISSHRVNYSGHIDVENRKQGLDALKALLQGIVSRWPNVRFVSSDVLVEMISPLP